MANHRFLSYMYVSPALYQTLQTFKMNFVQMFFNCWATKVSKTTLQSFSIFFNSFHPFLFLYLLRYLCLLFMFWAAIFMFHSDLVAVTVVWILHNFLTSKILSKGSSPFLFSLNVSNLWKPQDQINFLLGFLKTQLINVLLCYKGFFNSLMILYAYQKIGMYLQQ